MFFDRIQAKHAAKLSMARAHPGPWAVTLLFLVLTTGVSTVLGRVILDPFAQAAYDLVYWGYSLEEVIAYDLAGHQSAIALFLAAQVAFSLYEMMLDFGYTSYALRVARDQEAGVDNLFDGFARFGRVFALNLLISLLVFLWGLLGMLPGIALILISSDALGASGACMIFAGILVAMAGLRYALAPYYLLDDPDCGALEAIRRSKAAMRGWKLELFKLYLSFFGWMLLVAMLVGVVTASLSYTSLEWLSGILSSLGMLWLQPYMACTEANFYQTVGAFQPPSAGGYTGPYSDYRPNGGPRPF